MKFSVRDKWRLSPAVFTKNTLLINENQVMQSWESNYMKMLAAIATMNCGDILEVGFGMGISARFIQNHDIKTHTIIECHPHVIQLCKKLYKEKLKSGEINLTDFGKT